MPAPAPTLRLSDFDYALPPELIAQHPPAVRTASRLLRVRPGVEEAEGGSAPRLDDLGIADLPTLLQPGDLLVLNDTRVVRARLFGHKASGGLWAAGGGASCGGRRAGCGQRKKARAAILNPCCAPSGRRRR